MISRPSALAAAYGSQVVEPISRVTFIDPAGTPSGTLSIVGGDYEASAERWPRVTANVETAPAITATATRRPVSPYGGRAVLEVGARIGAREYVFTLATLDVSRAVISRPSGVIRAELVSGEARVNEDRYYVRSSTPAGITSNVVRDIIQRTYPGLSVVSALTSNPVLAVGQFPLEGDVWPTVEAIMDWADGEAIFRPDGSVLLRDNPVIGSSVQTFRTGETGAGTITGYDSDEGWAFNQVALIYEEDTGATPARRVGLWTDTTSTTGTGTAYGRHTYTERIGVDAGKLPSALEADRAAAAMGRRRQEGYRAVTMRTIPCPWIEPGDTVRAQLLGGTDERLLVTRVAFPLDLLDVGTIDTRNPSWTVAP